MCSIEANGYTWEAAADACARPAWKLIVPKYSFSLAVIIDYSPGRPPFKLIMLVPDVPVEWHDDLSTAKGSAVAHYVEWELKKAH